MIITLITEFCTVLSLVVIFLTLREMKIQRFKVFEPYIFPVHTEFQVVCNHTLGKLPSFWLSETIDKNSSNKVDPFIYLKNVGQGLAKDVMVKIDFAVKFEEYFNLIKIDFEKYRSVIDLQINAGNSSCWIEIKKNNEIDYACNAPYVFSQGYKFDYLLSVKDNSECLKIPIPSCVQEMVSLTILLYHLDLNDRNSALFSRLFDFMNIDINIHYKDNLDKDYSNEFRIGFDIPTIQIDSKNGGMLYSVTFSRSNNQQL